LTVAQDQCHLIICHRLPLYRWIEVLFFKSLLANKIKYKQNRLRDLPSRLTLPSVSDAHPVYP
jgi:hypothetical protein